MKTLERKVKNQVRRLTKEAKGVEEKFPRLTQLPFQFTPNGGVMFYQFSHPRRVLVVWRENYLTQWHLIRQIIADCFGETHQIIWYFRPGATAPLLTNPGGDNPSHAWARRRSRQAIQLLRHIRHWPHMFRGWRNRSASVAQGCEDVSWAIAASTHSQPLIVVGISAGGRMATMVADDHPNATRIICFGYPFQAPGADDDPSRYRHLESIATPTLIIQGDKDCYGGSEIQDRYPFSNQVSILGVEGDHDFDFSEAQIMKIKAAISAFIPVPK